MAKLISEVVLSNQKVTITDEEVMFEHGLLIPMPNVRQVMVEKKTTLNYYPLQEVCIGLGCSILMLSQWVDGYPLIKGFAFIGALFFLFGGVQEMWHSKELLPSHTTYRIFFDTATEGKVLVSSWIHSGPRQGSEFDRKWQEHQRFCKAVETAIQMNSERTQAV